MRRRLHLLPLLAAGGFLALAGCEEGLVPEIPDPGGGTQDLVLEQVTISPSRGDPVQFRVTVTVDGTPQSSVTVNFTTENPPLTNELFQPPNPVTNLQGIATATLSTFITTPSGFDVRATASGGGLDILPVTLLP